MPQRVRPETQGTCINNIERPGSQRHAHFPLYGRSKDGDLEILATQIAPDKIGRWRVVLHWPTSRHEEPQKLLPHRMGGPFAVLSKKRVKQTGGLPPVP